MGAIDGVFINAGVAKFGPLAQIEEALWDSSFDTNIKGPYFLIQRLAAQRYGKRGPAPDQLQAMAASIQRQIPLGRFATPEEMAATMLHLVAEESGFIVSTEIIIVDGRSQM